MATIVDKDQIVPVLRSEWEAIAAFAQGLDDEQWDLPTCLPGWTVKDALSHIVGTEYMLSGVENPTVDTSHLTHLRNPIAEANEVWVESLRAESGAQVLDRFKTVTAERIALLEAMSQDDFDAPSWTPAGPNETFGRFMRIRHFDSYHHELDMRDAVGEPFRNDPDHVAMALAEPAAAMGYIVGKKAGVPQGNSVAINLTGPVDQTYLVDVAERAQLVDQLDGEPTASIALDANLFLRLSGGRCDPTPYVEDGQVQLGGDQVLARQLATNLAYTI